MSAYLVAPEHIAALAAYAVSGRTPYALHEWEGGDKTETAKNVAKHLAVANLKSVITRYPDDTSGNRPGAAPEDDIYVTESMRFAAKYSRMPQVLSALDILNMAMCYEYQSCEPDDWETSLAAQQIRWIVSKAIRNLPGFDNSIRDYSGEKHAALRTA